MELFLFQSTILQQDNLQLENSLLHKMSGSWWQNINTWLELRQVLTEKEQSLPMVQQLWKTVIHLYLVPH